MWQPETLVQEYLRQGFSFWMSIVSLEKVQDKKVRCNDGIMQIEEHRDKK